MRPHKTSRPSLDALIALAAISTLFTPVWAGDWEFQDSISLSLTALDRSRNTNSTTADDAPLKLQVQPGFTLQGNGARARANVAYRLSALADNDGFDLSHTLRASGSTELYEDILILNASANANLVPRRNNSTAVDALSDQSERSQSFSFTLSPEFRHHLGRYADVVSRNSLTVTTQDGSTASDRVTRSMNVGIENGQRFSRLGWGFNLTRSVSKLDTRTETTSNAVANASYRIDRDLVGTASFGYSDSDAPTNRERNHGLTWSIGGNWAPNPRASFNATIGDAPSGMNWNLGFRHISRRTTISASYSRQLTNTSALQAFTLEPGVNDDGSPIVNPFSGEELLQPLLFVVPTDENFINTAASAAVTVQGRRTSVTGRFRYSGREYDVSGNEQTTYGFTLSGSRSISAKSSLTASLGYSHYSDTSDDSTVDASVGWRRTLGRNSSISTSLSRRSTRELNQSGYTEHRLSVIFSTRFL